MAATITILFSLWSPLTTADANCNSGSRRPEHKFEDPPQTKDKTHHTEPVVDKSIQVTTFHRWSLSFMYSHLGRDGGSERIAIRQPRASWRTDHEEWQRQQVYPNIASKPSNIAKSLCEALWIASTNEAHERVIVYKSNISLCVSV